MTATILAPSQFPLRFSEVVNVRGDFGAGQLANPKGIGYHASLDRILITVTPNAAWGRSIILQTVQPDGTRARFATGYSPFRDVESMLVVVPPAGPPLSAGFIAGDVYVNRGPNGEVSRLNANGGVLADLWIDLTPRALGAALTLIKPAPFADGWSP
jgi:hypothetical protein